MELLERLPRWVNGRWLGDLVSELQCRSADYKEVTSGILRSKYCKATRLIFVFILALAFLAEAAAPKDAQNSIRQLTKNKTLNSNDISNAEIIEKISSLCEKDCSSTHKMISVFDGYFLSIPVVQPEEFMAWDIAVYKTGGPKFGISELIERKKRGEALSMDEQRVLEAAPWVGAISFCKGVSSNAFLAKFPFRGSNGKVSESDVILTVAHAVLDNETGQPLCENFENVRYAANYGLYDGSRDFDFRVVNTNGKPPLNFENVVNKVDIPTRHDFLVFLIDQSISSLSGDIMSDKNERGAIEFSRNIDVDGDVYLIGLDPLFREGEFVSYMRCPSHRLNVYVLTHACHTSVGTSASLVAQIEDQRLVFRGLNVGGFDPRDENSSVVATELPNDPKNWNQATNSEYIKGFLLNYRLDD